MSCNTSIFSTGVFARKCFWGFLVVFLLTAINIMILKKSMTIMIEWKLMSMKSSDMNMVFLLDEKASAFILIVWVVTNSILVYSQVYVEKKMMFSKIWIMFMISMLMMILSPNMVSLVMGWEGLGMTSFILIMYSQNKKSMKMNRVGDITLLLSMMIMMNSNSSMFLWTEFLDSSLTWINLIVISMFSKSAQIPFSSWLTEAMVAPTPVSALVHSSTLVTAGIYLMIRFKLAFTNSKKGQIILAKAMMTLTMSSPNLLLEMDMKKLVALSTLSQISIMFSSISANLYSLAFFHMIMHAAFKALIFLCSSTFILMSNTHDLRKISSTSMNLLVTKMYCNVASMVLCALPFLSSFYSKDIIMEALMIKSFNKFITMMYIMLMMATTIYSLKMMMIINLNKVTSIMKMGKEINNQKLWSIFLLFPSVILGNKLLWLMDMNSNFNYLSITEKLSPLIMMLMMIIMIETDKSFKVVKTNTQIKQMWDMYDS